MMSSSTLAATWVDAAYKTVKPKALTERIVRDNALAARKFKGRSVLSATETVITMDDNLERMQSVMSLAMPCGASPIEASSSNALRHRLNRDGKCRESWRNDPSGPKSKIWNLSISSADYTLSASSRLDSIICLVVFYSSAQS